jgi:PPOX class probable F420-dependent enzyme
MRVECTGLRAAAGSGHHGLVLDAADRDLLDEVRRAVLVTRAPDGRPRPVPVCFVVDPSAPVIYTPLDEKPKRPDDPRDLARVRDIAADARVALLVDRWDEDWSALAWLRLEGTASLLEPDTADHPLVVAALRDRYEPYAGHDLARRPIIKITIERTVRWSAANGSASG